MHAPSRSDFFLWGWEGGGGGMVQAKELLVSFPDILSY